jgi:hypothetical protein
MHDPIHSFLALRPIDGCCRTGPQEIRSVKQCLHPEFVA